MLGVAIPKLIELFLDVYFGAKGAIKAGKTATEIAKNLPKTIKNTTEAIKELTIDISLKGIKKELLTNFRQKGVTLEVKFIPAQQFNTGEPVKLFEGKHIKVKFEGKTLFESKNEADINKFLENLKKDKNMLQNIFWKKYTYKDLLGDAKKGIPPLKPCFLAGTLVNTQTGLVAIEKLTVGQNVYTYNFKNNVVALQPILKLHTNKTEKYLKIHTNNDVIKATGNHRFWLPKTKKWVAASQLKIQDVLQLQSGDIINISKLEIIDSIATTYNLEIENNPNYFVGKNNILAHNTSSKKLSFSSLETIDVQFYTLDSQRTPRYVGQTIHEDLGVRLSQHNYEVKPTKKDGVSPKKYNQKKKLWMDDIDGINGIWINGVKGPFKMTPFEAAVVEQYELNKLGGKTTKKTKIEGLKTLENKKNPISEKTFNKWKNTPEFNPCKFYI